MERRDVLLVEDDSTLTEGLRKYLQKHKIVVHHVQKTSEIRKALEENPIGLVLVDCLLPDGSGVETISQLKKTFTYPFDVVLMSGVFTDPPFIKESVRAAQAAAFLKKPFDLVELDAFLPKTAQAARSETPARQMLYQMFRNPMISTRDKRRTLEALEQVHGFDLPFIYSLLVETKATGFLNMAPSTGAVYGVTFSDGLITQVDYPDEQTYLGALLMDNGFIDSADLEKAMQQATPAPTKFGQKLFQMNVISPHALDIAMSLQMHIRLSKTVQDDMFQINFVEAEIQRTQPSIDPDTFTTYLHDWIASKINLPWLKTHFLPWLHSEITKSPGFSANSLPMQMPLITSMKGFADILLAGKTLNQILEMKKWPEEPVFKAIHFLLTKAQITFKEGKTTSADRSKVYGKVQERVRGKNKLEIYDILVQMTGAREDQPALVYAEFIKFLGPEPAADRKQDYEQLKKLAEDACDFAKKSNRDKLKKELAKDDVELRLKAASQFEEAKNLLQRSQYRQSCEMLVKVSQVDPTLPQLKLYLAWARLASIASDKEKNQTVGMVEMDLLQIPPEEKANALYHFVMGLSYKIKGDKVLAKKQLEKALQMDSTMIVARRELNFLRTAQSGQQDVFNRDLKDLVGSLFRKAK